MSYMPLLNSFQSIYYHIYTSSRNILQSTISTINDIYLTRKKFAEQKQDDHRPRTQMPGPQTQGRWQ